jgi:hypothetical protein
MCLVLTYVDLYYVGHPLRLPVLTSAIPQHRLAGQCLVQELLVLSSL